jgi:hypothetical protein
MVRVVGHVRVVPDMPFMGLRFMKKILVKETGHAQKQEMMVALCRFKDNFVKRKEYFTF